MRSLTLACLVFLVACDPTAIPDTSITTPSTIVTSSNATSTTVTSSTVDSTTVTSTTSQTSTTPPSGGGCPNQSDFVDRGRVIRMDQPSSDTNSLGLLSWQIDNGCERFSIDFETTEGAPATTPPSVIVEFLESRQVLRVWTEVDSTVITDQLVETSLVDRLFVVRALNGGMFLDLHLSASARSRVSISNSPAGMTVELEPGTDPLSTTALIADRLVVTSPADGSETPADVEVTGYARTFEANVLLVATGAEGVVAQTNVTAADSVATWGEFRASLEVPAGDVSLFVGEESPEDGQLRGVTLSLLVR